MSCWVLMGLLPVVVALGQGQGVRWALLQQRVLQTVLLQLWLRASAGVVLPQLRVLQTVQLSLWLRTLA